MIVVFDLLLYLSLSPTVVAACSCCCRFGDEIISRSSSAGALGEALPPLLLLSLLLLMLLLLLLLLLSLFSSAGALGEAWLPVRRNLGTPVTQVGGGGGESPIFGAVGVAVGVGDSGWRRRSTNSWCCWCWW